MYKFNFRKSLGGLFLTSVGLISSYYFIYSTLQDIKAGSDIDYSFKGILIGPVLIVVGIYLLVFTNGGKFSIKELSSNQKWIFYFALIIGFALGLFAIYLVNHNLEMYGYDISNL